MQNGNEDNISLKFSFFVVSNVVAEMKVELWKRKWQKKGKNVKRSRKLASRTFREERCWFSIVVAEMKVGVEERQNPCTRRPTPCLKYKMRNKHK